MTSVKRKQQKLNKIKKIKYAKFVNDFWMLWKEMLKIRCAENNSKRTTHFTFKHSTHTHTQQIRLANVIF